MMPPLEPMSDDWCRETLIKAQRTEEPRLPLIVESWEVVPGVTRTHEETQRKAEQEFGPPRRAEHA